MCGLPGGYPDDLIDVDLDAIEGPEAEGVIRVSNADYLARPLQLSPTEATAVIVALRALRSGAGDATREIVDRTLAKLEAAVQGETDPLVDPGTDRGGARRAAVPGRPRPRDGAAAPGAADLLRADPRPGVRAGGRPARGRDRPRVRLPRRLVPQRGGAPAVPSRPDRGRRGARRAGQHARGAAARPGRRHLLAFRRHHPGHRAARPPGRLGGRVLPGRGRARARPAASSRSTCGSPTSAGCCGSCSGSRRTRGWCPRSTSSRPWRPPRPIPSACTPQPRTMGTDDRNE